MKRVDILCDDAGQQSEISQRADSMVCWIWLAAVQVCPSQEAASPVSLSGLMVGAELVVVYRTIGLVQGVCAIATTVVGKTTSNTYASACEEHSATISVAARIAGCEEVL